MLPGGDRSARTPRRVAVALLYQLLGADYLSRRDIAPVAGTSEQELRLVRGQLDKRILCPYTSSIGRLFDAVASLLDLRQEASFEGQAAMCLEFIADRTETRAYPLRLVERTMLSAQTPDETTAAGPNRPGLMPRFYLDPTNLLEAILRDLGRGVDRSRVSARFHLALVNAVVEVASRVGIATVALSGGCFQNRLLLERCKSALEHQGHRVLLQHQVPANDGGLALGQVAVALSELS
jgi:hydrogenase maturation protein HypF